MKSQPVCSPARLMSIAFLLSLFATSSALGAREKILNNFVAFPRGQNPEASLIADAAGNLYGTTLNGGRYGRGTVFELTPSPNGRWTESVLYSFTGGTDGGYPSGSLTFDSNGDLYGTTAGGGMPQSQCVYADSYGCGVVFELSSGNGAWSERVAYSFAGYPNDGQEPLSNVVFDSSGNLYGTTRDGGSSGQGIAFELSPGSNGWTESVLHNFTGVGDGGYPSSGVALDSNGHLYGVTGQGGDLNCSPFFYTNGCGVIFELASSGNGAWTESILHAFDLSDGASPQGNLAFDPSGNLYGTTAAGPGLGCFGGCGTVFRLLPNPDGTWTESLLYIFEGGPDGSDPVSGVVIDASGNLFGTTRGGGGGYSEGTVFELSQSPRGPWTETILYRFGGVQIGDNPDAAPLAAPLLDGKGNLYVTSSEGGSAEGACLANGYGGQCGALLKLTPAADHHWAVNELYDFPPTFAGLFPRGGLVSDNSGNLYGTAGAGGKNPCVDGDGPNGCGTIFQVQPQSDGGWKELTLYTFDGLIEGAGPAGNLIRDTQGNLYGMASSGGSSNCIGYFAPCGGTVFELSPLAQGWELTVLHTFHAPPAGQTGDGARPIGGLVMDSQGNLYGATSLGGNGDQACTEEQYVGCGIVFELSPAEDGTWKEQILYMFQGGSDGYQPFGSLAFDSEGALYGTTCSGGVNDFGYGTVFKLTPRAGGTWQERVIYRFKGLQYGDGDCPFAGVTVDDKGNLFGATEAGGSNTGNCENEGCGIVFELTPTPTIEWKETIIHTFQGTDGSNPDGSLLLDGSGNLYGSAPYNRIEDFGGGVAFVLVPDGKDWTERILHNFGTGFDGANPNGGLIFGPTGDLFGTTRAGGTDIWGTVFQLSSSGDEDSEVGSNAISSRQSQKYRALSVFPARKHPPVVPLSSEVNHEN